MARMIQIIDPESEQSLKRQRRLFFLALILSLVLFGYPLAKEYSPKWKALRAGRKLALQLSALRTQAILNKVPMEARFRVPNIVEVSEVSSCGPFAQRTKTQSQKLSDIELDVQFAPEPWVRENSNSKEPLLQRYCYDPLYGSSVSADGLAHGAIFLIHSQALQAGQGEFLAQILVEGGSGDLSLE